MISSVRRGLAAERDAVAPVLSIMGYEPVRFEDATAQPVPPRAVCVELVTNSDIYLLLLGEHYGEPMPDTGLAPTTEEWAVARNLGKPIVVFRRRGGTPEPRQAEFIGEVEAYQHGAFRGSFNGIPDLLEKLKAALDAARARLQPLVPQPITVELAIPWRDERGTHVAMNSPVLETHVVPAGPVSRLRAVELEPLAGRLARTARERGLIGEAEPLEADVAEGSVSVAVGRQGTNEDRGLRVTVDRAVSVWHQLPAESGAVMYDEEWLRTLVAGDLRLAAGLEVLTSEMVAIGIGLSRVESLAESAGPNSWTYPFMGRGQGPVQLEPDSVVPVEALPPGAPELAEELVTRLRLRLRSRY
jgi:hypothetical protein